MPQVGTEHLPLFETPEVTYGVPVTQRPSLADRYRAWRATKDGELVFQDVEARALEEARLDPARISVARIVENLRGGPEHREVNQDFRAPIARELIARHPKLAQYIEVRGAK